MGQREWRQGDGSWEKGTGDFSIKNRKKSSLPEPQINSELVQGGENWQRKQLNRMNIPYFPKNPKIRNPVKRKQEFGNDDSQPLALANFICPICMDYFVQATAVDCGHMFCIKCISDWLTVRPWCPICQTQVKRQTRIYAVDAHIEAHRRMLSQETIALIRDTKRSRIQLATAERKKKSLRKSIVRKYAAARLYFQSKGLWRGLTRPLIGLIRNFTFNPWAIGKGLLLMLIGCAFCTNCFPVLKMAAILFHFVGYLIASILDYPGLTPDCGAAGCGD